MLEPGPCCSLHLVAWRKVTKSPSGWRTLFRAVGCLSTSLSGSRSNWLNPFGFPISCRQILARFRTLPTALHRDHTPELALIVLLHPLAVLSGKLSKGVSESIVWQGVNLFPGDEPAPHCLVDSLPDEIWVYTAGLEQIQNRAQWACNSHTLHLFDIAFVKISSVKNQNFRDSAVASKMFGDCHMQLRGHDIGELVKTESRVVTVCAFRNFFTIL